MSAAVGWVERLESSPAVVAAREALRGAPGVWIVGGALRDAFLGREVVDLDLAVKTGEQEAARSVARVCGGDVFSLSERFATWRAIAPERRWHVDVSLLRGGEIEADLASRDLTINAMALPLEGGEPIDPHGGLADLEARTVRAVGEKAFSEDPLRLMRAVRIAEELGFELDASTVELARRHAGRAAEPAGERRLAELRRIVAGPDPVGGIELMGQLGLTAVVLPELEALRDVEQTAYHHLDVYGHTMEVLAQMVGLERSLPDLFGDMAPALESLLAEPLADDLTRAGALRLGALFHDIGKPRTRAVSGDGRVTFMGHDAVGAEMVLEICERLRSSRRLARHLEALTLHHLRLGFMVHERPLPRRRIYEYLRATEPAPLDVTLLTVADRLATRGPKTGDQAVEAHLDLARQMLAEALAWRESGPPRPPLGGDELAAELGIERGPRLGALLEEIAAEQFAGQVSTREEAIELARRIVAAPPADRSE